MKRDQSVIIIMLLLCCVLWQNRADAGAIIKIDEESRIDLGFRLQTYAIRTDRDANKDGINFETVDDFGVRKAGIRLGAEVMDQVSLFLQSDIRSGRDGVRGGMELIDAYATLKFDPWLQLVAGEHSPAVMRQNITDGAAILAFDRPAIALKPLSWGGRAPTAFGTLDLRDTNPGVIPKPTGRDTGITLFGSGPTGLTGLSVKYYAGLYDGVRSAAVDHLHYASRIQVNYGEPEPEYMVPGMYLGEHQTVSAGIGFDGQREVAIDGTQTADYALYTLDLFVEQRFGPGSLTFEGALVKMDLDGAGLLAADSATGQQAQGEGYYVQVGYLLGGRWQPWAEWEVWQSDDPASIGGFVTYRAGLSYFLKGNHANIKLAYESMNSDHNYLEVTSADCVESYILGLFLNY